jgi:uncharacterized protein (TIGR02145 family)
LARINKSFFCGRFVDGSAKNRLKKEQNIAILSVRIAIENFFMKKLIPIFFVFAISLVLISSIVLRSIGASSLSNTYLFLERMQVDTSTGMILLITPSTNFASDSTLTITFPHDAGEWCRVDETVLTATGAASSALDLGGDWDIDAVLPTTGSFTATCHQGDSLSGLYDRIVVTGIDALTGGVSYGLEISSNSNFKTVNEVDSHNVTVDLNDGIKMESITFGVNLVSGDGVTVTADVAAAETITCSIGTDTVPLGMLYKGGAYVTGSHTISTLTSSGVGGFYWSVYGEGDGSTEAGLYNSDGATDILPSTGSTTIDLRTTTSGFGLVVTSPFGNIPGNFSNSTPGVFGSINRTFSGTRVILYGGAHTEGFNSTVTIGARAGSDKLDGDYEETLTYVCGGFIGLGGVANACNDEITASMYSVDYDIVAIGGQCWMAENLNYASGNSWCYSDNPANCDTYGRLYDWSTATSVCPEGWRLPSDEDWYDLESYLWDRVTGTCIADRVEGGCYPAGTKMKTDTWGGDNISGFTALPAGYRTSGGSYSNITSATHFWSSDADGVSDAWVRHLTTANTTPYRLSHGQTLGFSVRCLRNN